MTGCKPKNHCNAVKIAHVYELPAYYAGPVYYAGTPVYYAGSLVYYTGTNILW